MIDPFSFVTFLLLLLLVLTICSGFFSGSEIALFSLPSHTIRAYSADSDKRKKLIAQLLSHPRDLLVTIFILNTMVNILLQNVASSLFGKAAGWLLKVGVPLLITLFLGEIIPKLIALQHNRRWAYVVAPSIDFFQRVGTVIRRGLTDITTPISRVMFFFLQEDPVISRDELHHVLEESRNRGILHSDEEELIHGYLDLREAQVKEIMRPREDILFYDIQSPLEVLEALFVDQEVTRVPVCEQEINNLLGIINARDYFIHRDRLNQAQDLKPLLQTPHFVPETASGPAALGELDRKEQLLAMVVDEYGHITGLISREDIIEEVIGDITDRRDAKNLYTRAASNVIIASGKLELDDFETIMGVRLPSDGNMVTIGGWLIEQMGDIPKSGEYYQTEDFLFHVLAAEPNKIRRLYIRKLEHSPQRKRGPR